MVFNDPLAAFRMRRMLQKEQERLAILNSITTSNTPSTAAVISETVPAYTIQMNTTTDTTMATLQTDIKQEPAADNLTQIMHKKAALEVQLIETTRLLEAEQAAVNVKNTKQTAAVITVAETTKQNDLLKQASATAHAKKMANEMADALASKIATDITTALAEKDSIANKTSNESTENTTTAVTPAEQSQQHKETTATKTAQKIENDLDETVIEKTPNSASKTNKKLIMNLVGREKPIIGDLDSRQTRSTSTNKCSPNKVDN